MCIIVAKPIDVAMPDVETLEECFLSNPDGAGFMYADGKSVRIRKGFMTFDDFVDALNEEIPDGECTGTAIVMHFRIATSGKVKPACCHPFPISDERALLQATEYEGRYGIAHNGVISGRKTYDGWSDTMDFVAEVVTPLMKMNPRFMDDDMALDLLEGACMSKLAILNNAGDIATVGRFYEDHGVLYSNESYLKRTWRYSSYGKVWGDANYYGTYGSLARDYTSDPYYGAPFGEKLEDLIAKLPYEVCADCLMNEECCLTTPYCLTEDEAEEVYAEEMEHERAYLESLKG